MEMKTYIRRPFEIEAIEITRDNIEEIAAKIGELRVRTDKEKTPFIKVDPEKVPGPVTNAYLGHYLTRNGDKLRVYAKKRFKAQYVLRDDTTAALAEFMEVPRETSTAVDSLPEKEKLVRDNVFETPPPAEPPPGGTYTPGPPS